MSTPPEQAGQIVGAQDVAHRYTLERAKLDLDAGLLGRLFGSAANAPTNIAGVVLCLFTVTSILLLFVNAAMPAAEFMQLVLPVITLVLGYLFGKRN